MANLRATLVGFISGFFIPIYDFSQKKFSIVNLVLVLAIIVLVEVIVFSIKEE